MPEKIFQIERFRSLMKLELFRSRNAILMTYVIIFGLLFFVSFLLDMIVNPGKTVFEHDDSFASALIIGGFIVSSLAFSDLTNTLKRYHYLTLPASTLEKFISMWLLTSAGWIVSFTFVYTVYTWLLNSAGWMLFPKVSFLPFSPFGESALRAMRHYAVWQSIFLLGATHFKGYVFPKMIFAIVLSATVAGIVVYFIMSDLFLSDHECDDGYCEILEKIGVHPLWLVIRSLFWWVFAPLCWFIAYMGLKEKEA